MRWKAALGLGLRARRRQRRRPLLIGVLAGLAAADPLRFE
jgi:hypothetical protein